MRYERFGAPLCALAITMALGACSNGGSSGGGGSDNPDPGSDPGTGADTFTVGGSLTGHSGDVTLSLNGSAESFSGGSFTFMASLEDGDAYTVSFASATGGESCTVAGGSGTISGADVNDVAVSCTGGSSGTGRRLSRIEEDFDLNGTPEMITTATYSDNGRSVVLEMTYTDDGTPDAFRRGDETIIYTRTQMTFSDAGLPLRLSSENTHDDGSNSLISFSYAYNGGQNETITQEVITPDTSISLAYVPTYTDGVITALNFDTGTVSGGWRFTYDGGGALESTDYAVSGTDIESAGYTWRTDGQFEAITKTDIGSGAVSSLSTVYDGEGLLQSAMFVDGVNPGYEESNYTQSLTYNADGTVSRVTFDPLSAGTDQASESYSWEDGPCYPMFVPEPAQITLPDMATGSNAMFPAGVFTRLFGCQPEG